MTNFERIKSMTIEEMANFLNNIDIDEVSSYSSIGCDIVFSKEVFLHYEEDVKEWLLKEYEG